MTYKELRLERLAKQEADLLEQEQGNTGLGDKQVPDPAENFLSPDEATNLLRDDSVPQEPVGNQPKKPEAEKDLEYWKNRCMTSEGRFSKSKAKYDENIFKMRKETSLMQNHIAKLEGSVRDLSVTDNEFDKIDNEHTRNVLGEDVVNSIKDTLKETRDNAAAQAAASAKENAETKADNAYTQFFGNVVGKVKGDMKAINNDPAFHKFLDTSRSQAGHTYRAMFDAAISAMDVDDVSDFFNTFLKIQAKEPQPVQDSVDNRIGPSGNNTNQDEGKVVVDTVTLVDVNKFKTDMARGAYKGRYSEMVAMQDRIEEAYNNGTLQ